jgi:hypothetical protein
MANLISSRPWPFRRPRLLAVSAVAGVLAISAVVATLVVLPSLGRPVHASGVGFGCTSTSGPVCTFKGHSASAQFEANTSCVTTDVDVLVFDSMSRSGSTATPGSYVYLSTNSYDSCAGTYSSGYGYDTTGGAVQFTETRDSLTATGNVTVQNYNGDGTMSSSTYTINLTWKGFGSLDRQTQDFNYQSAGFITMSHINGTSQIAYVSGTLSDGTTNFAASGTTMAEMLSATSGTFVTIQK